MIVFQLYITYWMLSVLAGALVAIFDPPWSDTFCRFAFNGPIISLLVLAVIGILAVVWQR